MVTQHDVGGANVHGNIGQPVEFGDEHVVKDFPFGRVQLGGEGCPRIVVSADTVVERAQGYQSGRVDEQPVNAQQGVITRCSCARKFGGEGLGGFQDFLDDNPCAIGGSLQIRQVFAWVGQTVRVIDAEPVDEPVTVELQQFGMGGGKNVVILDADSCQSVDIEEAAVVELLGGDLPARQPVPLLVEQFGQRHGLGAGTYREDMVVIDDDVLGVGGAVLVRDVPGLDVDGAGCQFRADAITEDGHEDRQGLRDVDVEPGCVRGGRAVAQHTPQRRVVPQRGRYRHVVRDDVDDDAQSSLMSRLAESTEVVLATAFMGDAGVVHDVVAMGGPRCGLQNGGAEQMADAQGGQVVDLADGVSEGEVLVELQTVRGGGCGGRGSGSRHIPTLKRLSDRSTPFRVLSCGVVRRSREMFGGPQPGAQPTRSLALELAKLRHSSGVRLAAFAFRKSQDSDEEVDDGFGGRFAMGGRGELGCDALHEVVGSIPPRGVEGIGVNDVDDEAGGIDPCRSDDGVGPVDEDGPLAAQQDVVGTNGAMDDRVAGRVMGKPLDSSRKVWHPLCQPRIKVSRRVVHEGVPHRPIVLQSCGERFPLLVETGRRLGQTGQCGQGGGDVLVGPGQYGMGSLDVGGHHADPPVHVDLTQQPRRRGGIGKEGQHGGFATVEAGNVRIDVGMAGLDEGVNAIGGDDSGGKPRSGAMGLDGVDGDRGAQDLGNAIVDRLG